MDKYVEIALLLLLIIFLLLSHWQILFLRFCLFCHSATVAVVVTVETEAVRVIIGTIIYMANFMPDSVLDILHINSVLIVTLWQNPMTLYPTDPDIV